MLALGVLDIAAEVNGHAGLVAHGPRVVTGFDGGNITRADLTLLSTVRLDAQPARQEYRRCVAWQLSVPASGFRCSDHRQPGS